jgi:hypothetical protein
MPSGVVAVVPAAGGAAVDAARRRWMDEIAADFFSNTPLPEGLDEGVVETFRRDLRVARGLRMQSVAEPRVTVPRAALAGPRPCLQRGALKPLVAVLLTTTFLLVLETSC